jgi:AraC family transcriptional regulator
MRQNSIDELIEYIESHLVEEISIPEIASHFSISPWHLQRVFKNITRSTLGDYIRGRRLTYSAEQLKSGEHNILDIALSTGFNSHAAFTRSFKKTFGVSPKEYRLEDKHLLFLNKPKLSDELIKHQSESISLPPQIVIFPEKTVAGFKITIKSPLLNDYDYEQYTHPQWKSFLQQISLISETPPTKYYGVSLSPSQLYYEDEIGYLACIEVEKGQELPEPFTTHVIPEQQVAVFTVKNRSNKISETLDYLYGHWLFDSQYKRAKGDDYEIFASDFDMKSTESYFQYVIPVELK